MEALEQDVDEVQLQIENLRAAIREISHEISNAAGVLRIAVYFLGTINSAPEKHAHYISLINSSLDQVEANLKRLKILREDPTKTIDQIPVPEVR